MIEILKFENDRGHILVDKFYVTVYYADNENISFKVPLTVVKEPNIKILHDVLKSANLSKYYLTEQALQKFDKIIEEWKK